MSGLLFHSVVRISIFLSSSIEGRGMLELDPGEDALVLPCSPSSPSSPWSEEALSDMSSKSRQQEKKKFFSTTLTEPIHVLLRGRTQWSRGACTKVKLHGGAVRFQQVLSGLVQLLLRELSQLHHKKVHGRSEAQVLVVEPVDDKTPAARAVVWVEHCRVGHYCGDVCGRRGGYQVIMRSLTDRPDNLNSLT